MKRVLSGTEKAPIYVADSDSDEEKNNVDQGQEIINVDSSEESTWSFGDFMADAEEDDDEELFFNWAQYDTAVLHNHWVNTQLVENYDLHFGPDADVHLLNNDQYAQRHRDYLAAMDAIPPFADLY